MDYKKIIFLTICVLSTALYGQSRGQNLQSWKQGWLEIHHINAKLGNTAFFIFPDGTTLLYDAGQLDYALMSDIKKAEYCLLPSDTISVAKQIKGYIHNMYPEALSGIDYAVISHFHGDHYGTITTNSPKSVHGNYYLSGITELYEYIPFKCLIDRGFPDYSYPVDLNKYYGASDTGKKRTFYNYRAFVDYLLKSGKTRVEGLKVGTDRQIASSDGSKYNFSVRNFKKNNEYWSGNGVETKFFDFSEAPLIKDGKFNENPLSIALIFSYGKFKYYVGGDISGVNDWPDVDLETTMAPIIGQVDAMSLHHHGYKDATNEFFLKILNPQTVIHQSLHIPHFQQNVLSRLQAHQGDKFALYYPTGVPQQIREIVDKIYKDYNVHIVIRVAPGGDKFYIDTYESNNSEMKHKNTFGPYYSSKK